MSDSKKCLKCGHVATFNAAPALACPACGAVYSKVEAAISAGGFVAHPTPAAMPPATSARRAGSTASDLPFIEQLRAESHYPAFRGIATVINVIGQLIAVAVLIGGFVALFKGVGFAPLVIGLLIAVLLHFIFRAGKEAALMLADLSDAAVRMAERQE